MLHLPLQFRAFMDQSHEKSNLPAWTHCSCADRDQSDYLQFTWVFMKLPLWSLFWWKVRKGRHPESITICRCVYIQRCTFRRCSVTTSASSEVSAFETPIWTQENRDKRRQISTLTQITDSLHRLGMWSILHTTEPIWVILWVTTAAKESSVQQYQYSLLTLAWGWNMTHSACNRLRVCLLGQPQAGKYSAHYSVE